MIKCNYYTALTDLALANAGYPNPKTLENYPEVYKLFLKRNDYYEQIDNLGFSEMSKEAYEKWLNTLKEEQRKQEAKDLKNGFLINTNLKD